MNRAYPWACAVFLLTFGFYIGNLCPDVFVGDAGEFITTSKLLGVAHSPGYPLYSLIGKIFTLVFPMGSAAYRINVCGAFFGSVSVALLFFVCVRSGVSVFSSFLTVLFLAVNFEYFSTALNAEVFMLNAFFAVMLLWFLFELNSEENNIDSRLIYLAAFFLALGLGNHQTVIFYIPGFILLGIFYYVRFPDKRKDFAYIALRSVLFILAGLSVYLFIYIRAHKEPALNWGQAETLSRLWRIFIRADYGTFSLALGEKAGFSIMPVFLQFKRYIIDLGSSFNWVVFICILSGWCVWWTRSRRQFMLGALLFFSSGLGFFIMGNMPFDAQSNGILGRFYILSAIVFIIGLGFCVDILRKAFGRTAYAAFICLLAINIAGAVKISQRNAFFAYDYGKNILKTLHPGSVFFIDGGDDTFYTMAYMLYARGWRGDLEVHDRGGLVFKNVYGSDFRRIPKDKKEERRIEVERSYLDRGMRLFYSTMNKNIMKGEKLMSRGFLFEPGREYDLADDYWEFYSLRGIYSEGISSHYYRLRALLPYYTFVRGMRELSLSEGDAAGIETALEFWRKAMSVGWDVAWLKDNISMEGLLTAYDLFHKNVFDGAEELYKYVLTVNPAELNALVNLGAIAEKKGDIEGAKKYYTEAIRVDFNNLAAHYNLAVTYWKENRWEDVVREFEIVYSIDPEYREVGKFLFGARQKLKSK